MNTPYKNAGSAWNQPPAAGQAAHTDRLRALSDAFRVCHSVSYQEKPEMHKVANALDSLLESHAALVNALQGLLAAGKHLATPATHDGLTLADAQAKARAALQAAK